LLFYAGRRHRDADQVAIKGLYPAPSFLRKHRNIDRLSAASRNQSLITLDSRRGAEDAEKTFLLFLYFAISALRENLAA
jgi:hypothetical protein